MPRRAARRSSPHHQSDELWRQAVTDGERHLLGERDETCELAARPSGHFSPRASPSSCLHGIRFSSNACRTAIRVQTQAGPAAKTIASPDPRIWDA